VPLNGKNELVAEVQPLSFRSRILKGVFLAALFVLPVLLIYQIALPVAGVFGDEFPELLRDKYIRWILVIACFFAAAFASNMDRFSDNRVGRFTAAFSFFFLVNLSFTVWAAAYPNVEGRFGRGAPMLQYLWMIGSFFYGIFTWWIVRRAQRRIQGLPVNVTKSQFTIGSILAWISLTGLMITLLKSSTLQILQDSNLDPNASIETVVCAVLCAVLSLPVTIWSMRTRRLLMLALGCWIICFAASCLLFAKLTTLEYVDRPEGEGLYRKQMGFPAEEVALLPDESIDAWVKQNRVEPENEEGSFYEYEDNVVDYLAQMSNDSFGWQMPYSPWDQNLMPLAEKFCREKQPVIERIRDLIRSCDEGTFPEFEHGLFLSDEFPKFASEMLFVDTRHAIAHDELRRAYDNLECITKLSKMGFQGGPVTSRRTKNALTTIGNDERI